VILGKLKETAESYLGETVSHAGIYMQKKNTYSFFTMFDKTKVIETLLPLSTTDIQLSPYLPTSTTLNGKPPKTLESSQD
jgi:hypothetical protein